MSTRLPAAGLRNSQIQVREEAREEFLNKGKKLRAKVLYGELLQL